MRSAQINESGGWTIRHLLGRYGHQILHSHRGAARGQKQFAGHFLSVLQGGRLFWIAGADQ